MNEADQLWEIAQRVCTPAELEAVRLREHMSQRAIAYHLGISREAVRDRLKRADQKIELEVRGEQDAGQAAASGADG